MGDSKFSLALFFGVSLVIASVFLYTLYPPKVKSPTPEVSSNEQTKSLLNDFESSESESDEDGGEQGEVQLQVAVKSSESKKQQKDQWFSQINGFDYSFLPLWIKNEFSGGEHPQQQDTIKNHRKPAKSVSFQQVSINGQQHIQGSVSLLHYYIK